MSFWPPWKALTTLYTCECSFKSPNTSFRNCPRMSELKMRNEVSHLASNKFSYSYSKFNKLKRTMRSVAVSPLTCCMSFNKSSRNETRAILCEVVGPSSA